MAYVQRIFMVLMCMILLISQFSSASMVWAETDISKNLIATEESPIIETDGSNIKETIIESDMPEDLPMGINQMQEIPITETKEAENTENNLSDANVTELNETVNATEAISVSATTPLAADDYGISTASVNSISVTNKGILYGYKSDGSISDYNMHGVFTTPKYRAYCGEHSIPEPVAEGKTKALTATKYNSEKMVKILYYGYGGPGPNWSGFSNNEYNDVYNSAGASTGETMACGIVVTAMAVHSVYTGQGKGNWYKPSGWEAFNKFINQKAAVSGYSAYKLEGGSGKQDLFTILPHEYTIKYNSNGGSGSMSNTSATYDEAVTLRSNSFTRVGYNFKGWATSSSGSVKYTNGASVKNLTATDGGTVTLYAVWEPNKLTIKYNSNRGYVDSTKYTLGSTIDPSLKNGIYLTSNSSRVTTTFSYGDTSFNLYGAESSFGLKRAGYDIVSSDRVWKTLDGSYEFPSTTSSDATLLAYLNSLIQSGDASLILYAIWTPKTYTLTFDPNGGTLRNPGVSLYNGTYQNSLPVTFGSTNYYSMAGDIPVRNGYTFTGWYLSNLSTQIYSSNGNVVNEGTYWSENKWNYDGNLTVYAGWKALPHYWLDVVNGILDNTPSDTLAGFGTCDVWINGIKVADDVTEHRVQYPAGTKYEISDIKAKTGYTYLENIGFTLSGTINSNIVGQMKYKTHTYNVVYDGNGATGGSTVKSTHRYDGHLIGDTRALSKNGFSRTGYAYVEWNTKADGSGTSFASGETLKMNLSDQSNVEFTSDGSVILYAIWTEQNTPPTITVKDDSVLTFIEGEKVTKDDLITNIIAKDKEDDAAGKPLNIRIVKIDYAEGKLIDSVKQPAYTNSWSSDVPSGFTLDTWFMALDKVDSPVTHKITYAVTDSSGKTTTFQWKVQVKYNEFPVIEAHDEYYSLDDAQAGEIKLTNILKKVHAWDAEDCTAHCPGGTASGNNCLDVSNSCEFTTANLEILGFNENVFLNYTEPGYEVVTYKIVDAYGKETIRQATIYIMDDGHIWEGPSHGKEVRFISEKNYKKNASVSAADLTFDELDAMNQQAAYQTGGLRIGSLWYEDDAYVSALTSIWVEGASPVEQWLFSREDVEPVRNFVENYGVGNSKRSDGLPQFRNKFGGNLK